MTRIADLIASRQTLSAEFFPPRTPEGLETLHATLEELAAIEIDFISVTYGAGGSTRDLTRDLVVETTERRSFPVMPHLTCIGHDRADLQSILEDYEAHGICNVLALAGDPPSDGTPARGDFHYASELVSLVTARPGLSAAVAAFPEGHPRSTSLAEDRRHLAEKLEAADFAITQFFFDNDDYFRMCDELAALGCSKPVLAGVMPLVNPETVQRFAVMNGARFPLDLAARVDSAAEGDRDKVVAELLHRQSLDLLERGAPGLHVYCMNRAPLVSGLSDLMHRGSGPC